MSHSTPNLPDEDALAEAVRHRLVTGDLPPGWRLDWAFTSGRFADLFPRMMLPVGGPRKIAEPRLDLIKEVGTFHE